MNKIILLLFYLLGLAYLVIPSKPLPLLENAVLSNEEGDTWQNPDQRGYYTNLTRSQVLSQIQDKLKISFFSYPLPNYRLNYRPEEAGTLVRDQLKSNYLEEVVYPLHSSVFINGWEPKLAPRRGNTEKADLDLAIYGVPYDAKVTLRPVSSTLFSRVLIWTLIFPLTHLVYQSFNKALYDNN